MNLSAFDSANPHGLVGRGEVLAWLLARAEGAMAGRGGVVLLEGDVGLGKSRLVAELGEGARWRGATVLLAGHDERSHRLLTAVCVKRWHRLV